MDIKIVPLSRGLMVVLGVCTLGIAPLAIRMKEKHWPKSVDESGLITRGGKRYAWGDFTKVLKVITNVSGTVTERYDLRASSGTVGIFPGRIQNAQQVMDYIWRRLPEEAKAPVA